LEVVCCLLQHGIVQIVVRVDFAQPATLKLQFFQPLHLIQLQPAILVTPLAIGQLCYADLPNRIDDDGSL